jgi:hypothetical protein
MVVLKEITTKSWLVLTDEDGENLGLLSQHTSGRYILLSKAGKVEFADKEDISTFFEEDIFSKVVSPRIMDQEEFFINSYPVGHTNPVGADPDNLISELPLYTKSAASKIYHCAGYYCVLFPKGWVLRYNPKLATLGKYEYTGPFKTEMETKSHLSMLKKNAKRNK